MQREATPLDGDTTLFYLRKELEKFPEIPTAMQTRMHEAAFSAASPLVYGMEFASPEQQTQAKLSGLVKELERTAPGHRQARPLRQRRHARK